MDTIVINFSNTEIVLTGISVLLSLIAVYNRIKSNFTKSIAKFIKMAEEDKSLSNEEKMDMVVKWIKQLIPKLFMVLFNDKTLQQMAQNIFDDMKQYRDTYVLNKTGLSTKDVINTIKTISDDPQSTLNTK